MEIANLSKEEKIKLAKLLKAQAEGTTIEFKKLNGEWTAIDNPTFNGGLENYRIRKTRPYCSKEEFVEALKKHGSILLLKNGKRPVDFITANENGVFLPTIIDGKLDYIFKTYAAMQIDYTWMDGTELGVSEE